MNLSVVVSTQPTQFQAATFKGDLSENLKSIANLGYAGVELAIRDPKQVDLGVLDQLLQKNRLSVPAIGTGQAWGEEGLSFTDPSPGIRVAAIERIKSHIPVASQFGAVIVIGLIRGIIKPGVTQELAMGWLVEGITECCSAAHQKGVRIALEPINRYETTLINTTDQALQLTERVKAENFGLLLDTFHMNIEEPGIETSIKKCNNKIFHFHVADSNRRYPGAGHLDFKSILFSLQDTGYSGWISGEFLPIPDAISAVKKCIQYFQEDLVDLM